MITLKPEDIAQVIFDVRGQRVILDADLAAFFGRKTGDVNQQRKRNADRFPDHYAFQLTKEEWAALKSQSVISRSHGGRRTRPWAYTEHGFAMVSMGLRGAKAARVARSVIDTFVDYRNGRLPQGRTLPGQGTGGHRERLQQAIYAQMTSLMDLGMPGGSTVGEDLKSVTELAVGRVKAVLEGPALKNAQVSAEIAKLEAETAKVFADAQKSHAESANIWADTYQKRLVLIRELRDMAAQLERDEVVELMDGSFGATPKLAAPPHS